MGEAFSLFAIRHFAIRLVSVGFASLYPPYNQQKKEGGTPADV